MLNRKEIKKQAIENLKSKGIELNGKNISQEIGLIKQKIIEQHKTEKEEFEKRMEKEFPVQVRLERQKAYAEYLRNTPPDKRKLTWKDFGKGMKWCD